MPQFNTRKGFHKLNYATKKLYELDEGQFFAKISKVEGNGKFIVILNDNEIAAVHIRGKMIKRIWIEKDDIVVISFRDGLAKENHKLYGKIRIGDIIWKIPMRHYGQLKKIDGFKLLTNISTSGDGDGGGGNGGLYEYIYGDEDEEEICSHKEQNNSPSIISNIEITDQVIDNI